MMAMSRGFKALLVVAAGVILPSCGEDETVSETAVQVTREVEVTLLGLEEAIDWNREMELISGDAHLKWAAKEIGIAEAALDEAVRLVLDPESKVIQVIAQDREEGTATKYADAVATSLKLARLRAEMDAVSAKPDEEGPLEPLESDQMTYEKARRALEEEPSKDRVLYRKKE